MQKWLNSCGSGTAEPQHSSLERLNRPVSVRMPAGFRMDAGQNPAGLALLPRQSRAGLWHPWLSIRECRARGSWAIHSRGTAGVTGVPWPWCPRSGCPGLGNSARGARAVVTFDWIDYGDGQWVEPKSCRSSPPNSSTTLEQGETGQVRGAFAQKRVRTTGVDSTNLHPVDSTDLHPGCRQYWPPSCTVLTSTQTVLTSTL